MKIFHTPLADTLSHAGQEFQADVDHVFEVPEEIGRDLLGRIGWSEHTGQESHADANEVTALRDRVKELEAKVAAAVSPEQLAAETKRADTAEAAVAAATPAKK